MSRIPPVNVWATFLSCFNKILPSNGVCWPNLGLCGPSFLRAETEKWLYLGLDGPNRDSEGAFSLCQPQLLVVSTPQIGPNAPPHMVFARLAAFWGVLARAHRKGIQKGSKMEC